MVGNTSFDRSDARGNPRNRVAENADKPPDLARAAARQHENKRRLGAAALRFIRSRDAAPRRARSADDRHRRRADRRAEHARPARTAEWRARNRHSCASRARVPAAKPKPTARHNRESESQGARRRTRRATRWVKSGLSMMTSASGRAATIAVRGFTDAAQDHRQPARDRAKTDNRQIVDREWAGNSRRRHGPPADAGELHRPATLRQERARQARAQRVAGFLRGDDVNRQRPWLRLMLHRAASSRTPTRKIFARSAAATAWPASAMIVPPAATAKSGKAGVRDILDCLRTDRRQIEAAILARLWRLDENADARRRHHPPLASQIGNTSEQIIGTLRRLDREHVVVGDHHRLPHVERPECRDHRRARARCRRGRAATADSGPARHRAR